MNQLMAKAKAFLILDQPFFASILLSMPMSADTSIASMATDGESISYNPEWVNSLSVHEVIFVLAHETLHCVFQHMLRREGRNPNKWNVATDYVINDILVNEKVGVMPKVGLLDADLVKRGGGTADGVYKLLPKDTENSKPGDKNGPMDELLAPGQTPSSKGKNPNDNPGQTPDEATLNQKQAEMRVKVVQAKNAAKAAGKLSAGLERLVKTLVKTETDWKSVLRRFLSERSKVDYSYAKPKRRFLAEDMYLPSQTGEKLGTIAVAVDCSGSINLELLGQFEREIQAIVQDTSPSEVKVIYFDAKVLRTETYGPDETVKLKPVGGGGTMFSPIFEALNESDINPVGCVVLTDLYCNDFGPTPDYPVLWACTGPTPVTPPFGEVTTLKVKGGN